MLVTTHNCISEGDDNNDGDNVKSDEPFSTSPEYKEMDINTIINGNVCSYIA